MIDGGTTVMTSVAQMQNRRRVKGGKKEDFVRTPRRRVEIIYIFEGKKADEGENYSGEDGREVVPNQSNKTELRGSIGARMSSILTKIDPQYRSGFCF